MDGEVRKKRAPPPPSRPPPPRGARAGRGPPRGPPPGKAGRNAAAQYRLKKAAAEQDSDRPSRRNPSKGGGKYRASESFSDEDQYDARNNDRYEPRKGNNDEGHYNGRRPSQNRRGPPSQGRSDRESEDDYEREKRALNRRVPPSQSRRREKRDDQYAYSDDSGDQFPPRRHGEGGRGGGGGGGGRPRDGDSDAAAVWGAPRGGGGGGRGGRADDVEALVDEVEEIEIDASRDRERDRDRRGGGGGPSRGRGRGGGRPPPPSTRRKDDWEQPLDIYENEEPDQNLAWTQARGEVEYGMSTLEDTDDFDPRGPGGPGVDRRGTPPRGGGGSGGAPPRGGPGRRSREEDWDDRGGGGGGGRPRYAEAAAAAAAGGGAGDDDDGWAPRDERHGTEDWVPPGGGGRGGRGGGGGRGRGRGRYEEEEEEEEDLEDGVEVLDDGLRRGAAEEAARDRRALGGGGGGGGGGGDAGGGGLPWRAGGGDPEEEGGGGRGARRGGGGGGGRPPRAEAALAPTLFDYRDIPFVFRELQEFVTGPPPGGPGTVVHCFIQRDRSGTKKMAPVYTLYSDHEDGSGRLLLSARKLFKSKTPYYVISTQREDLYRGRQDRSHHYLGKLRGNTTQTEYVLYDSGENPSARRNETDSESDGEGRRADHGAGLGPRQNSMAGDNREELIVVHYVPEKKTDGLRRMEVGLPRLQYYADPHHPNGGQWVAENWRPQREANTLANKFARVRQEGGQNVVASDRLLVAHKRESRYDPLSSCLVDFKGRARQASVKNYQLVRSWPTDRNMQRQFFSPGGEGAGETDDEEAARPVLLQMGKFGKDCFNMDYQWPLTMLQAFGICLSRFDTKLYY